MCRLSYLAVNFLGTQSQQSLARRVTESAAKMGEEAVVHVS